jgi:hypothetical protein
MLVVYNDTYECVVIDKQRYLRFYFYNGKVGAGDTPILLSSRLYIKEMAMVD